MVRKFGLNLAMAATRHETWKKKKLSYGRVFPVWKPALTDAI